MNIGDYQILEQIGATAGGPVHLAREVPGGTTALLKLPAHENAADGLRQEYALLQSLDVPEILKPMALLEEGARSALVLEPFAGEGLDAVLAHSPPLSLPVVLTLALQVARALAALHAAGIVHGDLRPVNFLLAQANDRVQLKLADLSRATARDGDAPPRTAVGRDWAYVSPEQTGRMQRPADYRTDFYSLGILLYRLLTGELPFQADDPLEWVHCHLARTPVPPHERVAAVPPVLSGLVLKLLAKLPEERYQSASGLCADLEQCLAQWQACCSIAPFELGRRDVADRFQIPLKLYGREREAAALLAAFETVAATGTPTLVTVAGYSGVGKSALIQTLHQPVVARRAYFLAGKFDQYQRDIPYATLAQAFDGLVRQLLGESEAAIGQWRQALHEALEPNAQLMVSLIPRLELVIGAQPPVPELPPQQEQGRFQLVFRRFLGVFATQEHPVVLFLDDLQWVDAGTLAVLADLAPHPDVRYLLLVGAYRDNEVDGRHPLMQGLDAIRQAGGAVQEIVLAPLPLAEVAQLTAEALHCPPDEAEPLAQLVWDKTGGNPFFTRQFLAALAEEKLLQFDAGEGVWRWNLARIQAKGFTDNIADLMVGKLARLPQETQDALARFACLGNAVDAVTLGIVMERPVEAVHALLRAAEQAGLVWRQEDAYTFLHDRVQEAAYALLPEAARAPMHLRVGRLLASSLRPEALAERIFEVVSQLNRGSEGVESQEERERIAELNLMAGQRAKEGTAYAAALTYLAAGAALVAEDCWERRHEIPFELEMNRAECEFLTGETAAAEERLSMLSRRAANLVDSARVACLRMELYVTLDRSDRAVEVCLEYLQSIGVEWSPHPTEDQVRQEYEGIWKRLANRSVEDLVNLPEMSDPNWRATMDVLTAGFPAAYWTDGNLRDLSICRMVNISLEHGNGEASTFGYSMLVVALGAQFGDYDTAYRFGKLALDLVEKRGLDRFRARVYNCFGANIAFWKRPLRECRAFLRLAFDVASRTGDLTFATYSITFLAANQLTSGEPLGETQKAVERALEFSSKVRFGAFIDAVTADLQVIRMFRGLARTFSSFNDVEFDENRFERHLEADPRLAFGAAIYWIRKMQGRFHAGDYAAAIAALTKADEHIWRLTSLIETADYHFLGALTRAAYYSMAPADEKPGLMKALLTHEKQLKLWAENCPENFGSCAALAAAEIARIECREGDAMPLYERAIRLARENGFVNNEAIANERAALFFQERGSETAARAYVQEAAYCYTRWGADGKVRHLEEHYPYLRASSKRGEEPATIAAAQEQLDLLTVIKAQQAISGEIVMDRLAEALLRIALENAGARKGILFVEPDIELLAVASPSQADKPVEFKSGRLSPGVEFSASVLNYVKRTRQTVILNDATADEGDFSSDEYFKRAKPKSLLCMPIVRQAKLIGILCLENDAVAGAFTSDRRAVLDMIASQAAISLETARLYLDLQRSQNDLQKQTTTLEVNEERLRLVLENSKTGTWDWDQITDIQVWSDRCFALLGIPPGTTPDYARFMRALHPEDRERIDRAVREALVSRHT